MSCPLEITTRMLKTDSSQGAHCWPGMEEMEQFKFRLLPLRADIPTGSPIKYNCFFLFLASLSTLFALSGLCFPSLSLQGSRILLMSQEQNALSSQSVLSRDGLLYRAFCEQWTPLAGWLARPDGKGGLKRNYGLGPFPSFLNEFRSRPNTAVGA